MHVCKRDKNKSYNISLLLNEILSLSLVQLCDYTSLEYNLDDGD